MSFEHINYHRILPFVLMIIFMALATNFHAYAKEEIETLVKPETLEFEKNMDEEILPSTEMNEDGAEVISLDECIEMALENHPELKAYYALMNASEKRVTISRSVLFPQVSFSSSYNRSESDRFLVDEQDIFVPLRNTETDSYSNRLSLSQKIYDFGRTKYSILAARENLNSAAYDMIISAETILFNVRQAYFEAVAAGKAVAIAQQSVSQRELQLKQAKGFYQLGRRSKIEVTKAEVDLANARLNLIKAKNSRKLSVVNLSHAIGVTGDFDYVPDDDLELPEIDLDLEQALESAQKHRPELLKFNSREKAQEAGVNAERAGYYPTLDGSASYGYSGDKPDFKDKSWGWGVSLRFDIFQGGRRPASVQQQQFNLEALRYQKERQKQAVIQEVQTAYYNMTEAWERIEVLRTTLESARENFELARGRYELGLSSNLEFADAQLALQQAENDLVTSALEYLTARARLEKAAGLSVVSKELIKNLNQNKNINIGE